MTLFVFADGGGDNVLGKAKELADTTGDRVVAFTSKNSSDAQRYIYFGADEVLTSEIPSLREWSELISNQVLSDANSKMVLFPSTPFCNALMGEVYSRESGRFVPFMDQADRLDLEAAGKIFGIHGIAAQKQFSSGQIALCSLRISSLSPPYEDSSRLGKIRTIGSSSNRESSPATDFVFPSSSDVLTVLLGRNLNDSTRILAEMVAERYSARTREYSSKIEVIYGPCFAIQVGSRVRDLPEFQRDLISISTTSLPISSISDSSVITNDLDAVLRGLVPD